MDPHRPENPASHLTSPVWVSSGDKPHLFDATENTAAPDLAALHRVMFVWNMAKSTPQPPAAAPSEQLTEPSLP